MKTLKALALISLAVFLLSLSRVLVTGQFGQVPVVHAQPEEVFISLDHSEFPGGELATMWALTESGGLYRMIVDTTPIDYGGSSAHVGDFTETIPVED